MNERLTDTPFEFSVRLTGKEVAFVRAAITKAASAEESKAAAQLFFKYLRRQMVVEQTFRGVKNFLFPNAFGGKLRDHVVEIPLVWTESDPVLTTCRIWRRVLDRRLSCRITSR